MVVGENIGNMWLLWVFLAHEGVQCVDRGIWIMAGYIERIAVVSPESGVMWIYTQKCLSLPTAIMCLKRQKFTSQTRAFETNLCANRNEDITIGRLCMVFQYLKIMYERQMLTNQRTYVTIEGCARGKKLRCSFLWNTLAKQQSYV